MGKKIIIDLKILSDELEKSIKRRDEYNRFDEKDLAYAYQCRIDTLRWVMRVGEEGA